LPVVIGGWDSAESYMAAIDRGEIPNPDVAVPPGVPQEYVIAPALPVPNPTVDPRLSNLYGTGNTAPQAGVMTNVLAMSSLLGGAWSGFDPGNVSGGLAILHAYANSVYGSSDLGVVRRSSEVLENEPSGIRPGTMPRIVIPMWARNERGSPI